MPGGTLDTLRVEYDRVRSVVSQSSSALSSTTASHLARVVLEANGDGDEARALRHKLKAVHPQVLELGIESADDVDAAMHAADLLRAYYERASEVLDPSFESQVMASAFDRAAGDASHDAGASPMRRTRTEPLPQLFGVETSRPASSSTPSVPRTACNVPSTGHGESASHKTARAPSDASQTATRSASLPARVPYASAQPFSDRRRDLAALARKTTHERQRRQAAEARAARRRSPLRRILKVCRCRCSCFCCLWGFVLVTFVIAITWLVLCGRLGCATRTELVTPPWWKIQPLAIWVGDRSSLMG
jgi:hypothetical protein